ncbi:hypothetical protein BXU08_13655 [Sphingomonas sp. LM7]|nr:hypothetical protein BXU08_13655 [Sphingomonas sp. LM7]
MVWFFWLQVPTSGPVIARQAVVVAFTPGAPSKRTQHPPSAILRLELDDGSLVTIERSPSCSSRFRSGDRVQIAGVQSNAGLMSWHIPAAPCAL